MVEKEDDHFMTLIVQNHGIETIHLKRGVQWGTVTPVTVLSIIPREEDPISHEPARGKDESVSISNEPTIEDE